MSAGKLSESIKQRGHDELAGGNEAAACRDWMLSDEIATLEAENAELRRRVEAVAEALACKCVTAKCRHEYADQCTGNLRRAALSALAAVEAGR